VKPIRERPDLAAPETVCCAVRGFGCIQVTADQLPALRQNPGPKPGEPLPPSFLKHADEQTVVAVAALFQAIDRHGLAGRAFTDWGVLAAPRYLGRLTTVQALQRFAAEGAWGISPHLIPHRTLHAISGTISQALQIHGPNLGVGGGPDAAVEVMRVAPTFLADRNLPGLWVVMTGWIPEPSSHPKSADAAAPSANGHHPVPSCHAVALALAPLPGAWGGPQLHFHMRASLSNGHQPALFSLESLQATLESRVTPSQCWSLGDNSFLELKSVSAPTFSRAGVRSVEMKS
jgi:hypothetical protein